MAGVTKEVAQNAGKQIADLVVLLVDQVPNQEQLSQFFSEGTEAGTAILALARSEIPKEQLVAVIMNINAAFATQLAEKAELFQLPSEEPTD